MSEQRTARIRELISAIRNHERFMIATHVRPDGDAAGALLATNSSSGASGRKPTHMLKTGCLRIGFLTAGGNPEQVGIGEYEAAILVDCGDFDRVGEELSDFISGVASGD